MLEAFAKWMQDRGSFRAIKREEGQPYLDRHFILKVKGRNAYLHRFWDSDPGVDLHDHPYFNISIVLKGEYLEHLQDNTIIRRKTGDIVYRTARTAHRIEIEPHWKGKVWTIFLTGKRTRDWGFYTKTGWIEASKITEVQNRDFIETGQLFPKITWNTEQPC